MKSWNGLLIETGDSMSLDIFKNRLETPCHVQFSYSWAWPGAETRAMWPLNVPSCPIIHWIRNLTITSKYSNSTAIKTTALTSILLHSCSFKNSYVVSTVFPVDHQGLLRQWKDSKPYQFIFEQKKKRWMLARSSFLVSIHMKSPQVHSAFLVKWLSPCYTLE